MGFGAIIVEEASLLISKDEDRSVDADRRDKGERINRSDVSVFVCAAT